MTKKAAVGRRTALVRGLKAEIVREEAGTRLAVGPSEKRAGGLSNVKHFRFILSIIFFSPWMVNTATGTEPIKLVEVFCAHAVGETAPEWTSLVGRLESRTADVDEALAQSSEFQTCLSENTSFFSTAEFAWKGRELIRNAVRHAAPVAQDAGVRVALYDLDFELPLIGTISVDAAKTTLTHAVDPYGYAERSKQYDQLWEEFLASLKNRLESLNSDRQVARNTR